MSETLPSNTREFIKLLPKDRSDPELAKTIEKFSGMYGEGYVNSIIWSQEEAREVLNEIGINDNSTFFNFYLHSFEQPDAFRSEDLYGLSEIFDDFKEPFWPEFQTDSRQILRISSIEGEFSLFYDVKSDEVYGVDWGEMKEFFQGNIGAKFNTFYDYLAWYYSDVDEQNI
jgi:hypothetical protein